MSDEFLKNPLSLFDIRGKSAIVTGATGAFGALAAKVLAGAGANVTICAGNAAELKKVEWPTQNQTIQGTVVVLVACIIVGTFLWVNDQVWKEVVKKLLGQ